MECYTYLRNVTDLLSDGKTLCERRFGQPFKGPVIPFGSLVEYHPFTAKEQSRIHQFGKKVLLGLFLGYALYAGRIWKGDVLVADLEELETMDASEIYSKRLNAKEVIFHKEKGEFIFPIADERIKTPGGDQELRTSTLIRQRPIRWRKSPGFPWRMRRVSSNTSRLTSGCRWSDKWFLVHVRKLHVPPSRWTQSQTLLAERRIIPHSTEVHWRIQNYSYKFGCQARKTHRWLLECLWVKRHVWSLDRFSLNLRYWKKNLQKVICGPGRDWRENSRHPGQIIYGQKSGNQWERMPSWRRSKSGRMRNSIWRTHENCEESISSTQRIRNSKKPSRTRARSWETSVAPAMPCIIMKKEDPVVPLERNVYGHPLAGLLWERQLDKILLKYGPEKVANCECLFVHRQKKLFLSVYVDDIKLAGKKTKSWSDVESTQQRSWFGRTNIFPRSCILGAVLKDNVKKNKDIVGQLQNHVWIANFRGSSTEKLPCPRKIIRIFFVVLRYGRSCQEMCGTILWVGKQDDSTTLQSIYSMHWWPSFQRRRIEICLRFVKSIISIFLKCFYLTRIRRPDILWSVNTLARSITKWTKACDKRLNRLISYIHHTCEYKQYYHVGNTAKQCRLGLFQDSDFAGDLEDSKSTSGGTLCVFWKSYLCSNKLDV